MGDNYRYVISYLSSAIRTTNVISSATCTHLDLSLGELQVGSNLDASRTTEVLAEVELFLQLQQLCVTVGSAQAPRVASLWVGAARFVDVTHR